jgi:hypothetical protein
MLLIVAIIVAAASVLFFVCSFEASFAAPSRFSVFSLVLKAYMISRL